MDRTNSSRSWQRKIGCVIVVAGVLLTLDGARAQQQGPTVGANVNVISGTGADGDWTLQRQNEPTMACSSRNPQHCLAGANDYRTVDIPFTNAGERITGDAWLGWYTTKDGGLTWRTRLIPGFPQDTSAEGLASPLKGFHAGADPIIRSGTNGLLYYGGLVFDREEGGASQVFVARFIDNNNQEGTAGDPIAYLGTSVVHRIGTPQPLFARRGDRERERERARIAERRDAGKSKERSVRAGAEQSAAEMVDKPWIAVDIPRAGAQMCTVGGAGTDTPLQTFPGGRVYIAYANFQGPNEERGRILFSYSANCGKTWSPPRVLSRVASMDVNDDGVINTADRTLATASYLKSCGQTGFNSNADVNNDCKVDLVDLTLISRAVGTAVPKQPRLSQGASLAIDPQTGTLHIVWRQFADGVLPDAVIAVRSNDGGVTFSSPTVIAQSKSIDQGSTLTSFRTNAYPTVAVDASSRIYVAWPARGYAIARPDPVAGDARIVLSTSTNGITWSVAKPVDNQAAPGHQIMPAMTFSQGKLQLVYYDLREDLSQLFQQYVDELPVLNGFADLRHTIEVRGAQANPGPDPVFTSFRLTQYPFGNAPGSQHIQQLEFNPPNLPLFRAGTTPFIGDYLDIAPGVPFVRNGSTWSFNTAPSASPLFHGIWTDNRDVRPPANGVWTAYTPPNPPFPRPATSAFDPTQTVPACIPGQAGMRNQNIYTARITQGLLVGAVGNSRPLGTIQRSFPVYAQNNSFSIRGYRLTIVNQPVGGQASFLQFSQRTTLDVLVPPRSTIARTVFARSSDPHAQINVNVIEIANGQPVPNGQQGTIILNPDPTNPDLDNPDLDNPDLDNTDIRNGEVQNPDLDNARVRNPDLDNPDLDNPDLDNPDLDNARVANPSIINPDLDNPDLDNPDLDNPDLDNPDLDNAVLTNGSLSDTTWVVKNRGNNAAAFTIKLSLKQPMPPGFKSQLIAHKVYQTPVALGCSLLKQTQTVLLVNVPNPRFVTAAEIANPDLDNPDLDNVTIALGPGESARITLRVFDPDRSDAVTFRATDSVTPAAVAQAVSTALAEQGVTQPAVAAVLTSDAPVAGSTVGGTYTTTLNSTLPGTWSVSNGTLPNGLTLDTNTGTITGTPTVTGTFTFTARFQSTAGITDYRSVTINVGAVGTSADVSVSATTSTVPTVGENITYTIRASNAGPAAATNVVVTDTLPEGATFVSITSSQGSCQNANGTIICNLGSLASGAVATMTLTARLKIAGTHINHAVVAATQADPSTTNNVADTPITPIPPTPLCATACFSGPTTFTAGPGDLGFTLDKADFNEDGRQDVVFSQASSSAVSVLLGDGAGGFGAPVLLTTPAIPLGAYVGDFNDDGHTDIIVSAGQSASAWVFLGNGQGGFGAPLTVNTGIIPFTIAVADFNRDGHADLVAGSSASSNAITVVIGNGNGTFQPPVSTVTGIGPINVIVEDFNRDGNMDVAASNRGTTTVTVLLGNGLGGFSSTATLTVGSSPRVRKVGDLNGDGIPDLVVVDNPSPNVGRAQLFQGNGTGGFLSPTNLNADPTVQFVASADVDGDGDLDLVANHTRGGFSVQLNNGVGVFGAPINFAAPATAGLVVGDFNRDGAVDVILAGVSPSRLIVFLNACLAPPADLAITATPSANSIVEGEFLNYVVTVTNNGPNPATSAQVTAAFNQIAGEFASATTSQGTCTQVRGTVSCSLGTLAPGVTANLQFNVNTVAGGTLTSVFGATATSSDPDPTNNTVFLATTVNPGASTFVVTNTNDSGPGSFRQALNFANADGGPADTITFNIPGGGVHTIAPTRLPDLPTITQPVIIDGRTQPGYAGTPLIEISGANADAVNGLVITGGNSIVRGLAINRFGQSGLLLSSSGNIIEGNFIGTNPAGTVAQPNGFDGIAVRAPGNTLGGIGVGAGNLISGNLSDGIDLTGGAASNTLIQGNRIGTDAAGTAPIGNAFQGIWIGAGASANTIGGTSTGAANVLSGNGSTGVMISGTTTTGNAVLGNFIGTNPSGTAAVGNVFDGVDFRDGATGNIIGGTSAGARNIISGNRNGLFFETNATGNAVTGNFIGTNAAGTAGVPNLQAGIFVDSSGNTIGGTAPGAANTIAFNAAQGIRVNSGTGNAFLTNAIFSNGSLGIDLTPIGVTANDANDTDTGANTLQNFPVLNSAVVTGSTTVQGTLTSTANTTFRLEFFASATCDASGNGEGARFLGTTSVTTNGSGTATFSVVLPAVTSGESITATATDPVGNTSEFSVCRLATVAQTGVARLYAVHSSVGEPGIVGVIDPAINDVINVIFVGTSPYDAALIPDGSRLYVTNTDSNSVSIVDTATNLVTGAISGVQAPLGIVVNPAGTRAYIAGGANSVYLIDTISNTVISTITVGNTPTGIALRSDGARAYVANRGSNTVSVIDTATNSVIATIPVGLAPMQVVVTPNGSRAYVSNSGSSNVSLIDTASNEVLTTITVGAGPNGIGVTSDGAQVYVSNFTANTVSRINTATNTVIGTIPFSGGPSQIEMMNGRAYVGASIDAVIRVIDTGTNAVTATINTTEGAAGMTVGLVPANTAVTNLVVTVSDNPDPVAVGGTVTYTITVTNAGPSQATNVNATIFLSPGVTFLGFTGAQCAVGQSGPTCTLGTIANGAVRTFTVDVRADRAGSPTFGVGVFGSEGEPGTVDDNFAEQQTTVNGVPTTYTVTNTNDSGANSLRQAILDANANSGARDTIRFNITGSGPHTINLATQLPMTTDPVIIDGTTQPSYAGTPVIELNGAAATGSAGLIIGGGNSIVRGLAINRFGSHGIFVPTLSDGNLFEGNYIGVNTGGTAALTNGQAGIFIGSSNNTVGGTSAAARNVISGNTTTGVLISGGSGNVVSGNYIGTNAAGTGAIPNLGVQSGIFIQAGSNNIIGGSSAGAGNLVSGNAQHAITIVGSTANGNLIQGNLVGTDASGLNRLANAGIGVDIVSANNTVVGGAGGARNVISGNGTGIQIRTNATGNLVQNNLIGTNLNGTAAISNNLAITINDAATGNTIGGAGALGNVISGNSGGISITLNANGNTILNNKIGTDISGTAALANNGVGINIQVNAITIVGNVIAFNTLTGVRVASGTSNTIAPNSIFSNGGLGIDLGANGVTPNDAGDLDTGANDLLNFPVLTTAAGGVSGTLNSTPLTTFTIRFFSNTVCDASGNGEGETLLGTGIVTVATNAAGNATLPTIAAPAGAIITALAIDPLNNTSEFSNCVLAGAAPAAFVVTNTNDSGTGSLRQAILDSNLNTGVTNQIRFNIPGTGPFTIAPASALPTITTPVVIDGTTQPGFAGTPIVEINGASPGSTNGLSISSGGSTVRGLVINRFGQAGINLINGSGNLVEGNYLGTNVAGTAALGNNQGIFINSSTNNTIGGTTAAARNLISGNGGRGVSISASGNFVIGNYIGTNAAGTGALGNGTTGNFAGVGIDGSNNTVAGNLTSGNFGLGINILGAATGNTIRGNLIGTDVTGTVALGNTQGGISVSGPSNTIGGTSVADRNVISGNTGNGINIIFAAIGTTVLGNYIGTNSAGSAPVPNRDGGVNLATSNNVVGGLTAAARNVISGNGVPGSGIYAFGVGVFGTITGNRIQGNFIGLNASGSAAVSNTGIGVQIGTSASGTLVGGTAAGAGNVISGNGFGNPVTGNDTGVSMFQTSGNTLEGNFIGTNVSGTSSIPNRGGGVTIIESSGNTVGGSVAPARNVISGNQLYGVGVFTNSTGNVIAGNWIGSSATGSALGNQNDGVVIDSSNNTIGGTAAAANQIVSNGTNGVTINSGTGNAIRANAIAGNGGLGIDLGNNGVTANDAGDADTGPNNFQNFPVLGTASGGVSGTLNSTPNTAFTIQFFSNSVCDASGNGEGGTLLGETSVTTNGSGVATIGTFAATAGAIVTAVAIDPSNNTSEFSACVTAGASGTANMAMANNDSPDPVSVGLPLTYTLTATNLGPDTATGVTVVDTLSSESVVLISATSTQGTCTTSSATTVTCSLGSIGNGASATVTILVVPFVEGNVGNSATVSAAQNDPVSANNTATAVTNAINGTATFVVTNTNDSGTGSLRQAIINANTHAGGNDLITFAIPGSGVRTITPTSPLPAITEGVNVDGTTQPDFNGSPLIELNGASAGATANGLVLSGASITIHALVINRFGTGGTASTAGGSGILIQGGGSNRIWTNFIGTDPAGTTARPNRRDGITIDNSPNNLIGSTAGFTNLLSGNTQSGLRLDGVNTVGTIASANFIGTTADGATALPNGVGLTIATGSGSNFIGSTGTDGNVISGNTAQGIRISGGLANLIVGNYIGTNAAGTALGNGADGLLLTDVTTDSTIGLGTTSGGNIVRFNSGAGVRVDSGSRNVIFGNSISSNTGLGIDLGPAGVTPNDATDNDEGANDLQNFPVLTTATTNGTNTWGVQGTLTSTPGRPYQVHVYLNAACDASGNGEGAMLLAGTSNVFTNENGLAAFSIRQAGILPIGQFITATATDMFNNTSEFSSCLSIGQASALSDLSVSMTDSPDPVVVGSPLTYTVTINNLGPGDAHNVAVVNQIPAGTLLTSATTASGVCTGFSSFSSVTCILGTVPNGGSRTITIVVAPFSAGTALNAASVSAVESDPSNLNNSAQETTTVLNTASSFVVTNTANSGPGSLRQAILDANARTGSADSIVFAIPGSGVHTIAPTSFLPSITDPVFIDGATQTGYSGQPIILLNGTNAGPQANGLFVTASGSGTTIRGLAIGGFGAGGLPADPGGAGIVLQGGNNFVYTNIIGLDTSGITLLPNRADGIFVDNSPANRIGGNVSELGNVISGNGRAGIMLNGSATTGTIIAGNYIGPAIDGSDPGGGQINGVAIFGAQGNIIGSNFLGLPNWIAYNDANGVHVASGTGNAIRRNRIFSSGALGINLGPAGVTANDAGDTDTGANNLQNFPVITYVGDGTRPIVHLSMNTTANTAFEIELFTNPLCHASGFGEGTNLLGGADATASATGAVELDVPIALGAEGQFLTATATDPQGNTSEFSGCLLVPRAMTLTAPSHLVGVGHVLNGTVNLAQPAPAGGVTIALSSDHVSFATVSPSSLTIPQGAQSGSFTITGVAAGDAIISATAPGYQTATFAVTATTSSLITLGTGLVVAPGNSSGIALSLGIPAPAGGVTVNLSSSDPSIATVTATVFIPAGLQIPAANPQVTGVAIGSANITAVASGFAPDTQSVAVTVSLSFSPTAFSVIQGRTSNITLNLSSPAPAGGLTINTSIDNTSVATVPSTVQVAAGTTSVQVPVTGVAVNSTTLRASAPGIAEKTAAITVNPPPLITVTDGTIGKNLQAAFSGSLGAAAPAGGLQITVTSLDATKILIAPNPTAAGNSSITFTVGAGSSFLPTFYVHSLTDTGTAQFQTSATGYTTDVSTITFQPSGFIINDSDFTTTTLSANRAVRIDAGRLNPTTGNFLATQELRGGLTVSVDLTSSNTTVGDIVGSPAVFHGGDSLLSTVRFDPKTEGTSTIRVVTPTGFTTPNNLQQIVGTVTAPAINIANLIIGKDLQAAFSGSLGAPAPAGNLQVAVSAVGAWSSVAPVSPARTEAASGVIGDQIYVAGGMDGVSSSNLVQAYQPSTNTWSTRAAMPTIRHGASAAVIDGKLYVAAGTSLQVGGRFNTLEVYDPIANSWATKAPIPTPRISAAAAAVNGKLYVVGGGTAAGNSAVLEVYDPVTDTWATKAPMPTARVFAAAAEIGGKLYVVGGALPGSVDTTGALEVYDPTTDSWSAGPSMPTPRRSIAAFSLNERLYTVGGTPVGSLESGLVEVYDARTNQWNTEAPLSVARWGAVAGAVAETPYVFGGATGVRQGIAVTNADAYVHRALVTTDQTAAGKETIHLQVTAGTSSIGNVYVQAFTDTGTAQIRALAPAFATGTGTVTFNPSGFIINDSDFTTNTFAANRAIRVDASRLSPTTLNHAATQDVRGGLNVSVALTSSDTNVGAIVGSPVVFHGGDSLITTMQFDPKTAGTSTIRIVIPAGFTTPNNLQQITGTVTAPNISIGDMTVGKDLQAGLFISLGATPPSPVTVTVTSNNTGITTITKDPLVVGTNSVTFTNVTSTSVGTIYVQGRSLGSTTVTVQALGYNDATSNVKVDPSGFIINDSDFTTNTFAANRAIRVDASRLSPTTLNHAATQEVRGGLSVSVALTSSDTNVGAIIGSPVVFNGGDALITTMQFDPKTAGTSTIRIVIPAGFTTPNNLQQITGTVTAPNISIGDMTVGKDLQAGLFISLGVTPPSPVTVTVTSSNTGITTITKDPLVAGTNSVTFTNVTSTSVGTIYVQGRSLGSTTVTVQAPGYNDGTSDVKVDPSGFIINDSDFTTTRFSANRAIRVDASRLNPTTLNHAATQEVRGGLSVSVALTSSDTNVGAIIGSPVVFNGGDALITTMQFDPKANGTSDIRVSTPAGFTTPSNFQQITATVTTAHISIGDATVGKDLQTSLFITLDAPPPSPVTVTVTSAQGSIATITKDRLVEGGTTLTFTNVTSTTVGTIYVQGRSLGTTTVTVQAPGYEDAVSDVIVDPSGFILNDSNFSIAASAGNRALRVDAARLNPNSFNFAATQELRGGLSVSVPVTSSNTTVGDIVGSPVIFNAGDALLTTASFDPKVAGSTTVTVGTPAGFTTPSNFRQIIATITP